jgi:hypothetical protein
MKAFRAFRNITSLSAKIIEKIIDFVFILSIILFVLSVILFSIFINIFPLFLRVELIILVMLLAVELIYLILIRRYHLMLKWHSISVGKLPLLINTFTYFIFIFLLIVFQGFTGLGPSITNVIKGFLKVYYFQRCCGITHWYDYENKTLLNEHLQQCGIMPRNITVTLYNITIKIWNIIVVLNNITINKTSVTNETQALIKLITTLEPIQTKNGFILLSVIVMVPLLLFLERLLYIRDQSLKDRLCIGDKLLFIFRFLRLFFTYFVVFSLILYFSLFFLINSEYPSAYLLLITTFLLVIAEASMGRDTTGLTRALLIFLLSVSVIALGVFAGIVFYLGGFVPSNMCMISPTSRTFQVLSSTYASLLPIAAVYGAIPYASTLLLFHYRFVCGLDEQDEKPGMRNSTDKIHTTS